jgi:hypothetical protein
MSLMTNIYNLLDFLSNQSRKTKNQRPNNSIITGEKEKGGN